jgi:hypothetical protein
MVDPHFAKQPGCFIANQVVLPVRNKRLVAGRLTEKLGEDLDKKIN